MVEIPKRLTPKPDTLRELYLKSGNQCAFPGCYHVIVDAAGRVVGEICHIEAAMSGGERFNPNMTNEERRSFENLMLMCHDHHIETNDVRAYPVDRLQDIKAKHEANFTNIVERLRETIIDETELTEITAPCSLQRMNDRCGWGLTTEQLLESSKEVAVLAERIKKLPIATRQVLVLVNQRSYRAGASMKADSMVPLHEVADACGLARERVFEHVETMDRYRIAYGEYDERDGLDYICLRPLQSGWKFWSDLRSFCEDTDTSMREVVVELRFDLLD
jgi:hypothetical protein